MSTDTFDGSTNTVSSPAENAVALTPDDDNDVTVVTRAVYVGGTGDLRVEMSGGLTVTFVNVQAGSLLPIRINKLFFTGTGATAIVGLW